MENLVLLLALKRLKNSFCVLKKNADLFADALPFFLEIWSNGMVEHTDADALVLPQAVLSITASAAAAAATPEVRRAAR
jgi:hypothetical protein